MSIFASTRPVALWPHENAKLMRASVCRRSSMTFGSSGRERPRRATRTETTALAQGTNAPLLLPAKATATCPHGRPPSAVKRAEGARQVVLERAGEEGEGKAAPGVRALGLRANANV